MTRRRSVPVDHRAGKQAEGDRREKFRETHIHHRERGPGHGVDEPDEDHVSERGTESRDHARAPKPLEVRIGGEGGLAVHSR